MSGLFHVASMRQYVLNKVWIERLFLSCLHRNPQPICGDRWNTPFRCVSQFLRTCCLWIIAYQSRDSRCQVLFVFGTFYSQTVFQESYREDIPMILTNLDKCSKSMREKPVEQILIPWKPVFLSYAIKIVSIRIEPTWERKPWEWSAGDV